ncbi:Hypothetical Protein FCC1311_101692 [Hondaea fermentalgiana]|uniref:Transmembrane protein n=1 Tax=Hondaea fermentalgiana TaxID=2315210 RepID=A0A2R5GSU5_9STRA|nr:Hypothetical Protein FCC1311_101692 [Hondaea fermentalgiana]|eukprot:GBG33946.1 Hypothetical Protein FCC1311_101692 [Hondaea fermentalgiana]
MSNIDHGTSATEAPQAGEEETSAHVPEPRRVRFVFPEIRPTLVDPSRTLARVLGHPNFAIRHTKTKPFKSVLVLVCLIGFVVARFLEQHRAALAMQLPALYLLCFCFVGIFVVFAVAISTGHISVSPGEGNIVDQGGIEDGKSNLSAVAASFGTNAAIFLFKFAYSVHMRPHQLSMAAAPMRSVEMDHRELQALHAKLQDLRSRVANGAEAPDSAHAVARGTIVVPDQGKSAATNAGHQVTAMVSLMAPVPLFRRRPTLLTMSFVSHALTLVGLTGRLDDHLSWVYGVVLGINVICAVATLGSVNRDVGRLLLQHFEIRFLLLALTSTCVTLTMVLPLRRWFLVPADSLIATSSVFTDASPLMLAHSRTLVGCVLSNLVLFVGCMVLLYSWKSLAPNMFDGGHPIEWVVGTFRASPHQLALSSLWILFVFHVKYLYHAIARPTRCLVLEAPIALLKLSKTDFEALCVLYDDALHKAVNRSAASSTQNPAANSSTPSNKS